MPPRCTWMRRCGRRWGAGSCRTRWLWAPCPSASTRRCCPLNPSPSTTPSSGGPGLILLPGSGAHVSLPVPALETRALPLHWGTGHCLCAAGLGCQHECFPLDFGGGLLAGRPPEFEQCESHYICPYLDGEAGAWVPAPTASQHHDGNPSGCPPDTDTLDAASSSGNCRAAVGSSRAPRSGAASAICPCG